MEAKKLRAVAQRILYISRDDLKTGWRFIRGLAKNDNRSVE